MLLENIDRIVAKSLVIDLRLLPKDTSGYYVLLTVGVEVFGVQVRIVPKQD